MALPVASTRHDRDAVADLAAAVPRAVLGDEDLVAIALRETACPCRSACRAPRRAGRACCAGGANSLHGALAAEFRVRDGAGVAIRIAEVLAGARDVIERVGRHVVAQLVAAVVVNHSSLRARIPVEADGVAHARARRLRAPMPSAFIRMMFGVPIGVRLADVARRADRNVELAVGPEGDELAAVVAVGRKAVGDDHRLRRIVEAALDVVEAQDAVDGRHVERAVAKRDARRLAQVRCDRAHASPRRSSAGGERDRVDVARRTEPTNSVPLAPERHRARVGHARRRARSRTRPASLIWSSGSALRREPIAAWRSSAAKSRPSVRNERHRVTCANGGQAALDAARLASVQPRPAAGAVDVIRVLSCRIAMRGDRPMNAPDPVRRSRTDRCAPADLVGLDMIRTLVGFDTTSRDSNLALIDWVRAYLEDLRRRRRR